MVEKAENGPGPIKGIKVWDSSLDWFTAEQGRQKKLTGSKPTQWELFALMIEVFENRGDYVEIPTADPKTPTLRIPKSALPVVRHIAWLYAKKRSPAHEALKDSLRLLAAQWESARESEGDTD